MRSQRSSSREYRKNGMRCLIMNGSKGRSPCMWVRSWIRSHITKVSSVELLVLEQRGGVLGQLAAR